jgi:tetratricopeptide (TPR) repeat protein
VWDLHDRYPAAVLVECDPRLTAERIARISALTESSVLILVDGGMHSERDMDDLFDQLKSQQIRVVLLQVLRRFSPQHEGRRQFWLPAKLSDVEADRFRHAFAAETPSADPALAQLAARSGRTRSPFFFGLTAFGRDFRALPSYVAARLAHLTDAQRQVIAFLSFAHHYGQQSLSAQSFATLLGLPPNRPVLFESMFQAPSSAALELLTEDSEGEWRTAHSIIALEALQQIFVTGSTEDRASVWRQSLSTWSKDFADFLRGDGPVVSERLLELARRVFVYRDNAELLGTERAAGHTFSQLIEDIPSPQGRIEVLRHASERFPEEAHFHAHLGRLLGIQGDFPRAVEAVDHAIALTPQDHVLHHMRGMVLRYQIRSRFEAKAAFADIVPLVDDAQRSFIRARELRPDNEHGYVSEIQLLLDFLDYAAGAQGGQVQTYISNPLSPSFGRAALEKVETLLDRVSDLYVGENPSPYIMDCRAHVQRIYGDYSAALRSFDNLLSRSEVAKPPVRRQIVWTILRRHNGQWADLSSREVDRAQRLLEENLEEETRDSTSLPLWLRAVRRARARPSLDSVIERVAYWKYNTGSLDAAYYLYVLHCLRAMDGSAQAAADMDRALEECRSLARYRRDRTRSLEWMGNGSGIAKLIHQSQLGEWRGEFREFAGLLARVGGRVRSIDGPQKGTLVLAGGVEAFFVPARSDIHAGRDENALATCYLGFSYDGPRAWAVERRGLVGA